MSSAIWGPIYINGVRQTAVGQGLTTARGGEREFETMRRFFFGSSLGQQKYKCRCVAGKKKQKKLGFIRLPQSQNNTVKFITKMTALEVASSRAANLDLNVPQF
jgi:hypothetical protein